MIFRKSILSLFIIALTLYVPVSGVRSEVKPEITGIDVRDVNGKTEIAIESSSPLSYTIYKPEDPYSVTVELQGASLGSFQGRMFFDRAGVLEIVPSRVEEVPDAVKLMIALTVPADLEPVQMGNSLVLSFVNPEADVMGSDDGPHADMEAGGSADTIEGVDFSRAGDRLLVTIIGNGQMTGKVYQSDNNKLILDIPGVTSSIDAPGVYEPPVEGIRIGQYPDKARIVFDLAGGTVYDVLSEGERVIVSFFTPGAAPLPHVPDEPRMAPASASPQAGKTVSAVKSPATSVNPCGDKDFVGKKISLDIQDGDLTHVFRLIADISEVCNIVVSPKVQGKISIRLNEVPWNRALDVILRSHGLDKRIEESIIRIAPASVLAQEEEQLARAKDTQEKAGDLKTMFFPINFAVVDDVKEAIEDAKVLSSRGFVGVDERTSAIIIRDVEDKEAEYAALIRQFDKPTPQVNIDARIVEVSKNFTKELGIQWGADIRPGANTIVGSPVPGATGFSTGNPLIVNLPAAVGAGTGAGIGFGYLGAGALRALDLQLSAMESTGKGRIISNPRIITMDNTQATIKQGKSIPYATVSDRGTETKFIDANLELTVNPHITPDGTIVLNVSATKNEPDFANTVNGQPAIDKKEANTRVLIKDGETLVIGGIFKSNESKSIAGVPGVGRVPLLRWLFKKELKVNDVTELLIFITPQVIKGK